jgi:hypothetical protein
MATLLNGAYSRMSARNYYGQYLFLYEAARGPDFFLRDVTGGSSFNTEGRANDNEQNDGNVTRFWQTIYSAIRNLTILIENIDDVKGSEVELNRIKGEAHVLRGLCYFDLMRLFAYPPLFSIDGQTRYNSDGRFMWGVPIINSVEVGTNVYKYETLRETAETTYNFIIEELQKGFVLLDGLSPRGQGYANAATALALLVRTYLYMNDWQNVIDHGEYWVSRYGNQYSMISWDNYPSTYHKSFNSESIFEFGYSAADNLGTDALNYWVRYPTHDELGSPNDGKVTTNNVGFAKLGFTFGLDPGGPGGQPQSRGLDMMMASGPDDIRRFLICDMGIMGENWKTIRKYVGDPAHFIHNIPVVRLPEIYLSLAEAYAERDKGESLNALYYLNKVVVPRRKTAVTSLAWAGDHPMEVLSERSRELMLEGHNYFDRFRRSRNIVLMQPIGVELLNATPRQSYNFGAAPRFVFEESARASRSGGVETWRVIYGIPLSEMAANRAMRRQQNPGYGQFTLGDDLN